MEKKENLVFTVSRDSRKYHRCGSASGGCQWSTLNETFCWYDAYRAKEARFQGLESFEIILKMW